MNRKEFLKRSAAAAGIAPWLSYGFDGTQLGLASGVLGAPHHRPKARRIIYLYMAGGPSQFETFSHKPEMARWAGKELPKEILGEQRLTGMSGNQASLPVAASPYAFRPHGESGIEISELLPHTAGIVDNICLVNTFHSEAINHGPANTFMQTGLTQSSDVQSSVPNIVLPRLGNVMGNFDKIKRIIEGPGDHDS